MKEQRWPGDYETIPQEFASSLKEERMAMKDINESFDHDYLALKVTRSFDDCQRREMEPSACTQLDKVGMQPHAREYVECNMGYMRSERQYELVADGQVIDHSGGIQFTRNP